MGRVANDVRTYYSWLAFEELEFYKLSFSKFA